MWVCVYSGWTNLFAWAAGQMGFIPSKNGLRRGRNDVDKSILFTKVKSTFGCWRGVVAKKTETETFLLLLTSGMYGAFLAFSLLRDSIRSLSLPQWRNQMTRVGTRTNAAGIKNNGEALKVSQTWVKQATNSKGKSQLLALPAHMIYMNDLFFSWREEVVMK